MKAGFVSAILFALLSGCSPKAEAPKAEAPKAEAPKVPQTVTAAKAELGCAMCVFDVPGEKACTPAIRIDGKVLALEGYASKGEHELCGGAKSVVVDGTIHAGKFVATRVDPAP